MSNTPKFSLFIEQLKAADMPDNMRTVLVDAVSTRAALVKLTGMVGGGPHPLAALAATMAEHLLMRQLITGDIAKLRMLNMPAQLIQHSRLVVRALGPLDDDTSVPDICDEEMQEAVASTLLAPLFGVAVMQPASQAVN